MIPRTLIQSRLPGRPTTIMMLAALVAATQLAAAGSSRHYDLSWYTIDNGGGDSASASFQVRGTIGQPDAGTLSGSRYILAGGFWSPTMVGDCNGDLFVDLLDHQGFVNCLRGPAIAAGPACGCFDFSNDADVSLRDFAALQILVGAANGS